MTLHLRSLLFFSVLLALYHADLSPHWGVKATPVNVRIVWGVNFPGCGVLGTIAAQYSNVSVNNVNISVTCVPSSVWVNLVNDLKLPQPNYDIYMLDSTNIGAAVESNTVQELTSFIQSPSMIFSDFFSSALSYDSQYPPNSGRYWGIPLQPDAHMLYYRADIYAQYSLEPPRSMETLLQHAQMFKAIYPAGIVASWCQSSGCNAVNVNNLNEIIWMFGGDVWDSNTYQVAGVLNSASNANALRFFSSLWNSSHPNVTVNNVDPTVFFCAGNSPLLIAWVSYAAKVINCNHVGFSTANIGYYPMPYMASTGLHVIQFGAQAMHLSSKSPAPVQQAALNFMQYMSTPAQQLSWASLGGYSVRMSVVSDPNFLLNSQGQLVLTNAVFTQTYSLTKQGIVTGIYSQINAALGQLLFPFVNGSVTAEAALNTAAQTVQAMINAAYPCGRVCIPTILPSSALTGLAVALATLCEACFVATLAAMWWFRQHSVMRASSLPFMFLTVFGGIVMLGSMYAAPSLGMSGSPTAAQCTAKVWLQTLGFAITFAAIFAKTYRIAVIFGKQKIKVVRMSNCKLFQSFLIVVAIFVIYLIAWTVLVPPSTSTTVLGGPQLETEQNVITCNVDQLHYIDYGIQLLMLAAGSVLAYQVREAPADFHEAKYIGIGVYNWAVVSIFVLIGLSSISDYNSLFAVDMLSVLLTGPVAIGALVVPKFLAIWNGQEASLNSNTKGSGSNHPNGSKIDVKTDSRPGTPTNAGVGPNYKSPAAGHAHRLSVTSTTSPVNSSAHESSLRQTSDKPSAPPSSVVNPFMTDIYTARDPSVRV